MNFDGIFAARSVSSAALSSDPWISLPDSAAAEFNAQVVSHREPPDLKRPLPRAMMDPKQRGR